MLKFPNQRSPGEAVWFILLHTTKKYIMHYLTVADLPLRSSDLLQHLGPYCSWPVLAGTLATLASSMADNDSRVTAKWQ